MFNVYILKSLKDQKYYIGYTADLEERFLRHNQGRERATKNRLPFKLEYSREFTTKSEAMKYEKWLKKQKSHVFLQNLIDKKAGS